MGGMSEYLAASREAMANPDDISRRIVAESCKFDSHLDDPCIFERDKDLQYALDHDMEDPDEELAGPRAGYDRLRGRTGRPYDEWLESRSGRTAEEELAWLGQSMSDGAVAERRTEYETCLSLREEAADRDFVRYGNCRCSQK